MSTEGDSMSESTALRVLLTKKLRFIRAKQHQNNIPTDEQLSSFLETMYDEVAAIVDGCDELRKEFGDVDYVKDTLPADTEFDLVDDALAKLLHRARTVEMAEAAESAVPTHEELDDHDGVGLGLAASRLWELDINRLEPGLDYVLNVQGGKKFYDSEATDEAPLPLFGWVSGTIWKTRPTYTKFYSLMDNYTAETGVEEQATQKEKQENWDFLNAVSATPVMRYVRRYVASKGWESPRGDDLSDYDNFKRFLYQTWFYFYRREGRNDSSAFEHVFLGEIRDGEVTGMHNWVHIMLEERKGHLNYKGYIKPRRRSTPLPDGHDQVMGIQFDWMGCRKRMSSIFVGTSPEFELALYTLLFASPNVDGEPIFCSVDGKEVEVKLVLHKNGYESRRRIGSAYPELAE